MKQLKLRECVLQKDHRIRLPKEIDQLGFIPGVTFFDAFVDMHSGDIILQKSKGNKVNNYGKNK